MSTFLRLELAGRNGDTIVLNTDHIVRIHPTWPNGCTVVTTDDTSVNVRASLDQLTARLNTTGGRAHVFTVATCDVEVNVDYEHMRADLVP